MNTCKECIHAEMCRWVDELEGRGCDFEEPCEDAVSREYLFKVLDDFCGHDRTATITLDTLADIIYELPSVTQKSGKWITKDGKEQGYDIGGVKTWYIQIMCSECGFIKTAIEGHTGQYHYCPNCGCRMVEPQESEEV